MCIASLSLPTQFCLFVRPFLECQNKGGLELKLKHMEKGISHCPGAFRGEHTVRRVRFRLRTNTVRHTGRRTDKGPYETVRQSTTKYDNVRHRKTPYQAPYATPYEHRTNTVRDVRSAPL
jgi:hypothetical protein